MGDQTNPLTVAEVLNRVYDPVTGALAISVQEITLAAGQELLVKDSDGFTVFKVDSSGNIYHLGSIIKL